MVQLKIEMGIRFSTLLLLSGIFLGCTDNNTQQQLTEAAQRELSDKSTAIHSTITLNVFEQIGNKKMQVKLGQYTFNLPDGWRDTSSYIYKSKDQSHSLTISFGKTRESMSLNKLANERRQQLLDTMGDEIEILSQETGQISTLPAIHMNFSFGDQNSQYMEYWATAFYAEKKYLTVSYVGPKEDKSLGDNFKHIVATSLPISQPEPQQVVAQFIWRQAHILRFQTPLALSAPRHYTYVSPSGIALKASLYNPGDSWPDTSVEDDAAKDLRFGGTQGKLKDEVFGNLAIQQLGYVFQGGDPLAPTRYIAHRAHIAGYGGRLFLYVKGFESQTKQIDEFWEQLMTSIVAESNSNAGESL